MKKHRRIGLWVCILIVFILFLLEANKGVFQYSVAFGDKIRQYIYDAKSLVTETFSTYANQSAQIRELNAIKEQKEKNDILLLNLQSEVAKMRQLTSQNLKPRAVDAMLVRAYSFVEMGQYLRVWLKSVDSAKFAPDSAPDSANRVKNAESSVNPAFLAKKSLDSATKSTKSAESKIFGLIKDGRTAGIAFYKDNLLLGALNGDPKVSYSVFIGEDKNMGILKTDINGKVVVEYINAWSAIKEGDEIITSGLDNIFFEGLGVGVVKKVRQEFSYIVAEVDLYNQNREIGYFWLISVE